MREIEPPFELENGGIHIRVSEHEVSEERIFHLEFSDKRKPLNITVGGVRPKERFWTSIPQGRQSEAEQYGKLIANYIRSKRKA
jgi:hypothetical protein